MYTNPDETEAMSPTELKQVRDKHGALREELTSRGELLGGAGMDVPADTTTIRITDSSTAATEGPFADGELQVSAFYVLECAERDRALEIARHILDFHVKAVEVRGVHDSTGLDDAAVA
jgi:hypothetical protein